MNNKDESSKLYNSAELSSRRIMVSLPASKRSKDGGASSEPFRISEPILLSHVAAGISNPKLLERPDSYAEDMGAPAETAALSSLLSHPPNLGRSDSYAEDMGVKKKPSEALPSSHNRFEDDFDSVSQLGAGEFGTVVKCRSKYDG